MCCARIIAAGWLGLGAAMLHGCVVLPVPHSQPAEFSSQGTAWAVPGTSTRRDFILRLGDPLVRQRDDSIFIYALDRVAAVWAAGGPGSAAGGAIRKTYVLMARFNAQGVLEELRAEDALVKDPCVKTGFCDPLGWSD